MNDANNGSKLYLYSITTVAILGGLLFGYDTAVISGAEKGLEAFFLMATDFQYDKVMHGITSSSALIGCVIGGALSGFFASRLGRRNSLRLASVLFFLSALGSYYPEFLFFNYGEPNMELLIAFNLYRVLGGIGVGLASAVCPMYIAEIAPSNIRGTLVSCNQFAIIFGMLVVYFVNFLIMGNHTNPIIDKSAEGILSVNAASDMWSVQTGWRYMFGSEDPALSSAGTSGRKGILYLGEGEWCKQSKRNSGRNQGYFQGKDGEVVLLWCGSYCYRYHAFRIPAGYWY